MKRNTLIVLSGLLSPALTVCGQSAINNTATTVMVDTSAGIPNTYSCGIISVVGAMPAWTSPGNALTSNGVYATVPLNTNTGAHTDFLFARDLGFAIPAGATVTGIEVCIQAKESVGATMTIDSVKLFKARVPVGVSQSTHPSLSTALTWYSIGSCVNLWGTTWLPSDINSTGFGVGVSVKQACCSGCGASSAELADIDQIQVAVFYNSSCASPVGMSCTVVLPVEMVSFTADPTTEGVQLNWNTATETNNAFFTIERSLDATNFEPIGTKKGAGNSDEPKHYTFTDENPYAGISYYRLKQTDYDGTNTTSDVVAVNEQQQIGQLLVYPNPATDKLYCTLAHNGSESVEIKIIDLTGRTIMNEQSTTNENGQVTINISGLRKGTYMLELQNNLGDISRKRFIKE